MDWFMGKGRRKDKDPASTPDDSKPYLQEDYLHEKINIVASADLDKLAELPQGLDIDEWIATHTISFFEHINLMYDTLSEFCTTTGCSSMMGPGNAQYFWIDEKGKKCKCNGPQYVDLVMTYTQKTVHDESVFPTKYGNVFPGSFATVVKKIHRLLFSVLAHIYHAHYKELVALALHGYMNMLFEHFMTFSHKLQLLDDKDTEILEDLYEQLKKARVKQMIQMDMTCTVTASSEQKMGVRQESESAETEENKENVNGSHQTSLSSTAGAVTQPAQVTAS